MNNNLTVVEQDGQRVLTTAQLAEAYGADEKLIQQNFNNK
ncbi:ORF6N domain-containing protein [Bacillus velezensis]|nr:ORF6N domain-containing protein [Bacillus velezensis]NMP61884.1 ORF6N domain-containing protein [Bacillus velezensis]